MHELGIVFHIIAHGEDGPRKPVAPRPTVTLQLGEVSGVVESLPAGLLEMGGGQIRDFERCRASPSRRCPPLPCAKTAASTYATVEHGHTCPLCQSPHTHLLQGNEMMIKEVEAVEPETSKAPAEKNSPHRLRYAALCGDFFVSAGGLCYT